jgi:hypothetical protein
MRFTGKEKAWLFDEDLKTFFFAEAGLLEEERLSTTIEEGLW